MPVTIIMRDKKGKCVGNPISDKDQNWKGLESTIVTLHNLPIDKRHCSIEITSEEIEGDLLLNYFKVLNPANFQGIKVKGSFSNHSGNFIGGIYLDNAQINKMYLGSIIGYEGYTEYAESIINESNAVLTGTKCNELHILGQIRVFGDLKLNNMDIGLCRIGNYDTKNNVDLPIIYNSVDFSGTHIDNLQWKNGVGIKGGKLNLNGTIIENCIFENMNFFTDRGFKPIQYQINEETKLPDSFKYYLDKHAILSQ
ncbi:MAG: hypothetical protein PHF86_03770 [Candidatus Nanoarchaeia archaeon]|nr:hypothetical protein [Candidatus Nanoarchaeia archaeon]